MCNDLKISHPNRYHGCTGLELLTCTAVIYNWSYRSPCTSESGSSIRLTSLSNHRRWTIHLIASIVFSTVSGLLDPLLDSSPVLHVVPTPDNLSLRMASNDPNRFPILSGMFGHNCNCRCNHHYIAFQCGGFFSSALQIIGQHFPEANRILPRVPQLRPSSGSIFSVATTSSFSKTGKPDLICVSSVGDIGSSDLSLHIENVPVWEEKRTILLGGISLELRVRYKGPPVTAARYLLRVVNEFPGRRCGVLSRGCGYNCKECHHGLPHGRNVQSQEGGAKIRP